MKILLVEDTKAIAALMMARLISFGHEVIVAENGQVAIDKFATEAPDLLLMDINMPIMNGFEAASRIRAIEANEQWAWTPILFLTASDTVENLVTAIEAGGDDFIAKTIPEAALHAKMKALSRIAALRQRLATANRLLAEQASRDGLTGLCNRRHMDLRTDAAWAEAHRLGQPLGLLMIDVDNFKKYNDHYGHQSGDECLRAIAATLMAVVEAANARNRRTDAFAARYGGEEFAVILPNTPATAVGELAEEILAAVRARRIPHAENADWGIVTTSIGGAHAAVCNGPVSILFHQADTRLYRAKNNGRNRAELTD